MSQHEELTVAFDHAHAAAYDQRFAKLAPLRDALHLVIGAILADLPAEARILCVGAGTGQELIYLARKFPQWRFAVVEPAAPMLEVCRQKARECGIDSRCVFHDGYLDSLPPAADFDAATSLLVSQFVVAREARTGFFRAIAARLRPGGYLVTADLASDTAAAAYQSLLEIWLRLMRETGSAPEQIERLRTTYGRDVALLPLEQMSSMIVSARFETPVLFLQTVLIHACMPAGFRSRKVHRPFAPASKPPTLPLPVRPLTLLLHLATLLSATIPLPAAATPHAHDLLAAKRILFLGDSITYGGTYVDFIEAALRQHEPGWKGEILDLGLPSETVSGLSEPGHAGGRFPRPDLHERLDRVLAQVKPDLVIACYGMNDGIYHPLSEERFAAFRSGIKRLREKVTAAKARIIHVTPPVFDPHPVRAKLLPAGRTEYPQAYAGYDEVLARYSAWLLEQRTRGWQVIDLHGPMLRELNTRRAASADFAFAKDAIHPDRLGHAVIARTILTALQLPAPLADAPLQWAQEPESERLRLIRTRRKLLSDAWLTATGHQRPGMTAGLPLPEAEKEAAALGEKLRNAP